MLRLLHANLTTTNPRPQVSSFQCLRLRFAEHFWHLYSCQPEAVGIGIVITGAPAMAFDERRWAELFQTGARRCQGLPRALCSSTRVHHERVTNPEGVPAWRTWRDLNGLAVDSYHHSRSFTHNTPADEGLDARPSQWLHAHRHWLGGWQPVGIVIPWCKVTNIVDVAEHEGHGAETSKTAPSSTQILAMCSLISLHI